jgi:hypothetical protein
VCDIFEVLWYFNEDFFTQYFQNFQSVSLIYDMKKGAGFAPETEM